MFTGSRIRTKRPQFNALDSAQTSTKATDEFPINTIKRQELREAIKNGKKLLSKGKLKAFSEEALALTTEEKKSFQSKLDRAIRQNTLLTYSNLNLLDILLYIYSDRIKVNNSNYLAARTKIQENYRTYKSKTCLQLKLFVQILITQDRSLLEISDNSFFEKVIGLFLLENYFTIFYFIKNYLNINSSTDLGKQFLQNIFTNLAVRVRIQFIASKTKDKQDKVLEFFNKVVLLEDYDTVDITDFQQLSKTFRSQKVIKKRNFAETQRFYRNTSPIPKKQQLAALESDVHTSSKQYINEIEDSFEDNKGNIINRKTSFVIDSATSYLIDPNTSNLINRETSDIIDEPFEGQQDPTRQYDNKEDDSLGLNGIFDILRNFGRITPTLAYRIRSKIAVYNTTLYGLDLRNFVNSTPVDKAILEGTNNEYKEIEESQDTIGRFDNNGPIE